VMRLCNRLAWRRTACVIGVDHCPGVVCRACVGPAVHSDRHQSDLHQFHISHGRRNRLIGYGPGSRAYGHQHPAAPPPVLVPEMVPLLVTVAMRAAMPAPGTTAALLVPKMVPTSPPASFRACRRT
jgi:hypothetical protein